MDTSTNSLESEGQARSKNQIIGEILLWTGIYLTMILGMIAKSIHDNTKNNISISFEWSMLNTTAVILPLLISPMVFGSLYSFIQRSPKNLGTFIFAFQNGFFWKSVFTQTENSFQE